MTTPENVLYASTARPWLKYYAQKYIDQTLPTCSAFDYVCQQNKNRLGEAALNYYGRKFTYADFIVNVKKTAAALRGVGTEQDAEEAAADAFDVEDEDCALESELVGGDTRLTVTGVSAHASVPEKGKNAAKMLVHVLAKLGIGGAPIALLDEAAGRESAGEDLGIAGSDKVSGALTINLGLLFAKAGKIDVTFDCRYPVFFNPETIGETVQRRLAPAGYTLDPIHPSTPHHVPESSELVAKLMDVYNTISGENAKPFAIGGGTYARHLKEGVAYGMLFPGELELEHQANESIDVANFVKAARIYAYAIVALCA